MQRVPSATSRNGLSQLDASGRYIILPRDAALPIIAAAGKVTVRPIASTDADAYRSILERTTEEDRYCRFFHVVNHFDLGDIKRFVEPRPDTVGVIAEADSTPLGVAHIFFVSDEMAEIAIVVAHDTRQRGVGHALLEHLIGAARARRCKTLVAYALSLNSAFSHLAQSIGMTATRPTDATVTWSLKLT